MSRSLPNRIFVQSQFYTFKCDASKMIKVNAYEFLKLVSEMSSLNVSVIYEICWKYASGHGCNLPWM